MASGGSGIPNIENGQYRRLTLMAGASIATTNSLEQEIP
jgi:hypothetical protein